MRLGKKSKLALAFLLLFAGASWVLLRDVTRPRDCTFTLDLARLRALAASIPGDRARELRVDRTNTFEMPDAVVVTGGRFALTPLPVFVYQLVFADRTILVDTGMDAASSAKLHGSDPDAAAWLRVKEAMHRADAIYITHEHADHLGGLVVEAAAMPKLDAVHLTRAQLAHLELADPLVLPPSVVERLAPLELDGARAVAPGVVLIAAPGHTPGSQLVFVQLADGREVLFLGDTAWHTDNLAQVRIPPRLTSLFLHNDRAANVCQLAALHQLGEDAPAVSQVPGHDGPVVERLVAAGVMQRGLR